MTHNQLKKKIMKKFGTVLNFCNISELEYTFLRRFLNRSPKRLTESESKKIESISLLCDEFDNVNEVDLPLGDEDRLSVFLAIKQLYGTEKKFCEKNPEYSYHFINNITSKNQNGNLKASRKTKRIVELMDLLTKLLDTKLQKK